MSEHEAQALLEACAAAYQAGRYEATVAACRRVVDEAPYLFDAYFYLAAALSDLGRAEEALAVMLDAQRVHPASAAVDFNLGELARALGRPDEARGYYESALRKVHGDARLADRADMRRRIEAKLASFA